MIAEEQSPMSDPVLQNISVFELSPPEKLQLVQDLWDDLAATPDDVPIHPWQKEEVERRKANLMNNPASGLSWEEVKRNIRRLRLP
jgi:putative addiction module component (TIGR02574 family)